MPRSTALPVLALATGLALTGCTQGSQQDAASTASAGPSSSSSGSPSAPAAPQSYELGQTFAATTSSGAEITVEIPAEAPTDVEQLRRELGIDPVSYAKVGIDNRQGTEDVSVDLVTLYDEDGRAYEFGDLSVSHIGDWGPTYTDSLGGVEGEYGYTLIDGTVLGGTTGDELHERSTALYNQYRNGTDASGLEVTGGWLASAADELPERITGITVQPDGTGEELPMAPVGERPGTNPGPSSAPSTPADEPPAVPGPTEVPMPGAIPDQNFTYDEALAAWQGGMPYYDAFCLHYEPTTDGGRSQCEGIEAGTVDSVTGEYLGG